VRNRLRLQPWLFPPEFTSHRVQVLVDDVDVVAVAFPDGWFGLPVAGFTPEWLLGSEGQLQAADEPREVALGGSDSSEDSLRVRIHRAGAEVIWDQWRITDIERTLKAGAAVGLGTFRFEAADYGAELARATVVAGRQWPARLVAERLRETLIDQRTKPLIGSWIHGYISVRAPTERPDSVEVRYYARDPGGTRMALPGSYIASFPVDSTDPYQQARAIVARLIDENPVPNSAHRPRTKRW
jgi:hypothetical protein